MSTLEIVALLIAAWYMIAIIARVIGGKRLAYLEFLLVLTSA